MTFSTTEIGERKERMDVRFINPLERENGEGHSCESAMKREQRKKTGTSMTDIVIYS